MLCRNVAIVSIRSLQRDKEILSISYVRVPATRFQSAPYKGIRRYKERVLEVRILKFQSAPYKGIRRYVDMMECAECGKMFQSAPYKGIRRYRHAIFINASSKKSMGKFRLRKFTKGMIQGDFQRSKCSKAVRHFGSHFRFVI